MKRQRASPPVPPETDITLIPGVGTGWLLSDRSVRPGDSISAGWRYHAPQRKSELKGLVWSVQSERRALRKT
jgi:hypothetical protein